MFGIIITLLLLINYLTKSICSNPKSTDYGQIIPHVFALKTGILILFPVYIEYYDYCSGFMVADFPWANIDVGSAISNEADSQPFPYATVYSNMNFASMYLIAFSVIVFLALILFVLFKRIND